MAVQLGSKIVGSTVKIKENGSLVDYIIVHKGIPSTKYDSSCDGIWLLRRNTYNNRRWNNVNMNNYADSEIHSYLNSTFLYILDSSIRNKIKQVNIPYHRGDGTGYTSVTGANGLSTRIFLLSGAEIGGTPALPSDGDQLSYYISLHVEQRGANDVWWLRSPVLNIEGRVAAITTEGPFEWSATNISRGVRPAFILPSNLDVDSNGTLIINTAPTTPGSISLPATIKGGVTFTVSWEASFDAENNLQGYYLQRSTNGGSTWTQIYQGSATSTTDRLTFGLTDTVMYRVKAYDSGGFESAWRASVSKTVVNNNAPTSPTIINVPTKINSDNSITITWSASSDIDNNLSGYKLERKVDDETWIQIFTGDALSYTDFITKGWGNVIYRVKAYDSLGDESDYTTSPTRQVNNNTAPSISGNDEDLGLKTEAFSLIYTVSDIDEGQIISVIEEIDGIKKREYEAISGLENALIISGPEWQEVLNGQHTIKIIAADSESASTIRTYTFTKNETEIELTLKTPLPTDDMVTKAIMNITRQIPLGASFTVEVCNNGNDTEPNWEDITNAVINGSKFFFTNTEKTADNWGYNFRIKISRNSAMGDCFISSVGGNFE